MNRTRRILPLAALAATALAARPAAACDPAEMNAYLSEVGMGALNAAKAALTAALPHATAAETTALQRALTVADEACGTGDPVAGARLAANLARIAGQIEARGGAALDLDLLG